MCIFDNQTFVKSAYQFCRLFIMNNGDQG